MSLHSDIMNLPIPRDVSGQCIGFSPAYTEGHRDARHAAAELAQQAEAELTEWRKLNDPATLHANLLRGIPARLTRDQLLHLAGQDAQEADAELARLRDDHEGLKWERDRLSDAVNGERAEVARLRAECERLRVALQEVERLASFDDWLELPRIAKTARAALTGAAT